MSGLQEPPAEILEVPCEGLLRAQLTALFGLVIIVWSAGFEVTWKRRQALIAFGWGELGANKPPPSK